MLMQSSSNSLLTRLALLSSLLVVPYAAQAVQDVSGNEPLSAEGQAEGANFQGDFTLTVDDTQNVNDVKYPSGISTNTPGEGTVDFQGTSTVFGTVGDSGQLKAINLQGGIVSFKGNVSASTIEFSADGTLNLDAGKQISGTLNGGAANSGTLNLLGDFTQNTDIGATNALSAINIKGGNFTLNHDIKANTNTVENGAKLTVDTAKTITGKLVNQGTVTLNAAHQLDVAGDYNQDNTATLALTVEGQGDNNAPNVGTLNVTGTATLHQDNTIAITPNDNQKIQAGDFPIITANNIAGNAPTKVTGSNRLYDFSVLIKNNDLMLHIDQLAFLEYQDSLSLGFKSLAGVLNPNNAVNFPALDPVITLLNKQTTQEGFENALSALSPMNDDGLRMASTSSAGHNLNLASQRMDALRVGWAPNSGQVYSAGDISQGRGAWAQVYGNDLNQKNRIGANGYDAKHVGGLVGTDWAITSNTLAGVALGYANTRLDTRGQIQDRLDINSFQGLLYASMDFAEPVYVNALLGATYNEYSSVRHIDIPGAGGAAPLQLEAGGDFKAWQYNLQGELGYLWQQQNYMVTPRLSIRYMYLNRISYNETGAGPQSLQVNYKNSDELRAGAGLKLGYRNTFNEATIIPVLQGNIFYDLKNTAQSATSNFMGGGATFITPGVKPPRTSYQLGAALEIQGKANQFVNFSYDFEWRKDFNKHAAMIKYRYEW